MSFRSRMLLVASVCFFLLGLGLFLLEKPKMGAPPIFAERSEKSQTQVNYPTPPVETLAGPWFRAPSIATSPSPKPAAPPPHVDTTSIVLLGSSTDKNGVTTFFFKHVPSGQVIILKPGDTKKGWTLQTVADRTFTLSGAGGLYEVSR